MAQVSIIVPVYQVEAYLRQCIDSILAQTFTDFELILVDDGSKDQSGAICDEYSERDSRICTIHTENKGAAAARNAGLARASGEYIAFVDSDGYISETMLERMCEVIGNSKADLVICNFLHMFPDEKDNFSLPLQDMEISGREVLAHRKTQKNYGVWTVVWNKLYKRKLFENLRFPEGKYFEDEFFSDQLYVSCGSVHVIPDVLYFYRVWESSTMNTQKTRNYLDLIDAFRARIDLYLEQSLPVDEVYKILIFLLEPYSKCAAAHFQGQDRERLRQARAFIRKTARLLMRKELSPVKKGSLLAIGACPSLAFRGAVQFRGQLEKYL